jgi:hypothetical protein
MLIKVLFISFTLYKEIINDLQIVETALGSFIRFSPDFFVANGFQRQFACFGIIPEIGGRSELFFFLN